MCCKVSLSTNFFVDISDNVIHSCGVWVDFKIFLKILNGSKIINASGGRLVRLCLTNTRGSIVAAVDVRHLDMVSRPRRRAVDGTSDASAP